MMKILTFTTLWPNQQQPLHGLFVRERMKALAKLCDVKVVAPIPWCPFIKFFDQRYMKYSQVSGSEKQGDLEVFHPRYLNIPKIFKSLEANFMYRSLRAFLRETHKRFSFELIDAHWAYPDGCAAGYLAKELGIPFAVTVRGSDITVFAQEKRRGALIRQSLREASQVICVSGNLRDDVLTLGIAPEKVSVIENGVDIQKFHPVPQAEARQHLGLPSDGHILVSIGHLSQVKGFELLIEAMRSIQSEQEHTPRIRLFIVGGNAQWGGYQHVLEEQITRYNLQDTVILVGAKPPEELKYWYSAADVFCLASSREGCPNVVLESLACGTPVVATPVGAIPDLLPTQDFGILVQRTPEDIQKGILEALNKTWDHNALVQRARTQFSWEATDRKVYHIFERI